MRIIKSITTSIRKNPMRALIFSYIWAVIIAFLFSPGVIFNFPSNDLFPFNLGNGINQTSYNSNTLLALVHAFIIAFLILPGQIILIEKN